MRFPHQYSVYISCLPQNSYMSNYSGLLSFTIVSEPGDLYRPRSLSLRNILRPAYVRVSGHCFEYVTYGRDSKEYFI
jgi:hypothetical protein